ncbi:PTS system cellobiose-specific IIC component [Breznakia blatticola]|uniref:Permease IIC component n=1 Tax=Breznakia blatticola TaxID=1754012 RepID=A0A4R8A614_9FIRM|nr:PTS transporter subunit EIIC [Breznakia blatticola]TDW26099.1 PTS system cellobiose-specific IIC component [Breznakia blatticola]
MFEKLTKFLEKRLLPIFEVVGQQVHIMSIQSAFQTLIPVTLIGAVALLIQRPPVSYETLEVGSFFYNFMKGWSDLSANYGDPLRLLNTITLGSISVYLSISFSYFLSSKYSLNQITSVFITFTSFLLVHTLSIDGGLSNRYFGGEGMFSTLIVVIVTVELLNFLVKHDVGKIKLPEAVPPVLQASFTTLFPSFIIYGFWTLIVLVTKNVFGTEVPGMIMDVLAPFLAAFNSLFGTVLTSVLAQIAFWFGIHSDSIWVIMGPIFQSNFEVNVAAYGAGVLPNALPHIVSSPLVWGFGTIGGSGATLAFAIQLVRSKSEQLRAVGKIGIIPSFFNVNEPILFGAPIVLNPVLFIPFVLAQAVNISIAYGAMAINLVNKPFAWPGSITPVVIQQFLISFDWRSIILWIFLIAVDYVIWYPFFKMFEKEKLKEEGIIVDNYKETQIA